MDFLHSVELFYQDSRLVEQFIDAVVAINNRLEITSWNYGASLIYGYSENEALYKSITILDNELDFNKTISAIESTKVKDPVWRGDVVHTRKDNTPVDCRILINYNKGVNEHLMVSRNISEQKSLEKLVHHLQSQVELTPTRSSNDIMHLYDKVNEGFVAFDVNWNYVHINKNASTIFGRAPEELIGKNVWEEFPKTKQSNFYFRYLDAMKTQQHQRMQEYSAYLDRWFEVDLFPSPSGLSVLFRDITEFKRTSALLNEREMLYRNIVETAHEGIWTIDDNNLTTFINPCMARMLGYERQELINKPPFDVMDDQDALRAKGHLERIMQGETVHDDFRLITKSGQSIWVQVRATPLYSNGRYVGALGMLMDVTERRRREDALNVSYEQLRQLNNRLLTIREEERSAIARELHDELGQQLTALKMDAYWVSKNMAGVDVNGRKKLARITEISANALEIVEKKSVELHPSMLHDLGLLSSIEWQNLEFAERFSISMDFDVQGSDEGLPENVPIVLYRVHQEALHNIARHALASAIKTNYFRDQNIVQLSIEDDGRGFDTKILEVKRSLGILGMRERCAMVGGAFTIESVIGKGTKVTVAIPISIQSNDTSYIS